MHVKRVLSALPVAILGLTIVFWWVNRPTGEIILDGINARPVMDHPGSLYVFARLTNNSGPDWLNSAESGEAMRAEIFSPADVDRLSIPANSSVQLAEDGAHIRLFGVAGDLAVGRLVPVTIAFQNAGKLRANVKVGSPLDFTESRIAEAYGVGRVLPIPPGEKIPTVDVHAVKIVDGWRISVSVEDFEFSNPDEMMGTAEFGVGHGHIYISGLKLGRVYEDSVDIGDVAQGRHEISVILVSDDHRAFTTEGEVIAASTIIESDG